MKRETGILVRGVRRSSGGAGESIGEPTKMTQTDTQSQEILVRQMPIGVNHIKMVTPEPEAVAEFFRDVVGIPNVAPIGTMGGQGPTGMFGVDPPPTEPHPPH